jgi:hypothetical protein
MIIEETRLVTIFCLIDDFCKEFEPEYAKHLLSLRTNDLRKKRSSHLCMAEIVTITVLFHLSKYRTFKDYYIGLAYTTHFPGLPSYSQFIRLMKRGAFPLFIFLQGLFGSCTGISFVDSTILTVCHIRRASSHRVFASIAKRGKTSTGWFFGLKLHLVINHRGEILAFMLTPGNTDDRKPVPSLAKDLFGTLVGDRGYISSLLFNELWNKGIQLMTRLRKGMRNKLMPLFDKLLLRKRGIIESVHNKLKNNCQIEHHRHRSLWNFLVNLLSGLVAYSLDPLKPTLKSSDYEAIMIACSDAI